MTDEARFPRFHPDFIWGVSTSAYQIEGAVAEAGRGPSTWDDFCAMPGRVFDNQSGQVACDHYHRYREDLALMKQLGIDAYRFSCSWSRVLPDGVGQVNQEGLDFYDRLIDGLLEAGIAPAPTLFHWDTPSPLEAAGGWLNRDITDHFAAYAGLLAERFGDRVKQWITINEPVVLTLFGYGLGQHAPGRTLFFEALPAAHHQLLAHGKAVQALRAAGASNIGIANNHAPVWSASENPADRMAAAGYDALTNWLFADPILLGRYPNDEFAAAMPGPVAEDLAIIASPIDWYGINHYQPANIGAPGGAADPDASDGATLPAGLPFQLRAIEGYPKTDFGWSVVPEGLGEILRIFRERYRAALPPVYITENGCAVNDGPNAAGLVDDQRRVAYLAGYTAALAQAIDDGADVRGYFHWSLLDNFEWAVGYSQRFGLVHVDFDTLLRTPKASFDWYRRLIAASHGLPEGR